MTKEDLAATVNSLSKQLMVIATAALVLSAYLVQRAVEVLVFRLDPLSPLPQAEQWGLKFSYLTLSVVWPIALGFLCATFGAVRTKRDLVMAAAAATSEERNLVMLADAFYLCVDESAERRLLRLLGWMPCLSVVCVVGAQLSATMLSADFMSGMLARPMVGTAVELGRMNPVVWLAVNWALQLLSAAIGLRLAFRFARRRELELACTAPVA